MVPPVTAGVLEFFDLLTSLYVSGYKDLRFVAGTAQHRIFYTAVINCQTVTENIKDMILLSQNKQPRVGYRCKVNVCSAASLRRSCSTRRSLRWY